MDVWCVTIIQMLQLEEFSHFFELTSPQPSLMWWTPLLSLLSMCCSFLLDFLAPLALGSFFYLFCPLPHSKSSIFSAPLCVCLPLFFIITLLFPFPFCLILSLSLSLPLTLKYSQSVSFTHMHTHMFCFLLFSTTSMRTPCLSSLWSWPFA